MRKGIKNRGFASMTPERRAEVTRKGGVVAQSRGTGHRWDVEEAREAGRKGRAKQLDEARN